MGKGRIISHLGAGQYDVKNLSDRTQADKALIRINAWIAKADEALANLPVGDPEHKGPGLRLNKASLQKQKEYLESIPGDQTVSAWCADYSLDLSGDVGIIEINGDPDTGYQIRPGYNGAATYAPSRDGQTQNIRAMTPEQAFYNLAMMPGWQKWQPTFRLGTITDKSEDVCNVRLDDAISRLSSPGTGELNINQAWDLADVSIEYMGCNGAVFNVGDRVVVEFEDQNFDSPKVIGFESNPKPCGTELIFYLSRYVNGRYFIERYSIQQLSETGENQVVSNGEIALKPEAGVAYNKRMFVVAGSADSNSIIIQCQALYINGNPWPYAQPYDGINDWWPHANLKVPIERFNETEYEVFEMGQYLGTEAKYVHLSPGGTRFGRSWGADNSDEDLFAAHLMLKAGFGTDLMVVEGLADQGGTQHPPSNIENNIIVALRAPCVCNDKLLLGFSCNTTPGFTFPYSADFLGYYIGEWPANVSGLSQWYYGTTPFLSIMTRKFLVLSQSEYTSLNQIIYHDGKVFVFFNFNQWTWVKGVWMDVYDAETTDFILRKTFNEGWDFTKASKVVYLGQTYLCFSIVDTWDTGNCSPVYLVDTEELEVKYRITMPFDYFDEQLVVVNKPSTDRMMNHHNRIRHEYSLQNSTDWTTKVYYLGKSAVCTAIAQEHLNWLLSTGRNQHEDENGDLVNVRALKQGILSAGENLAWRMPSEGTNEDIDYMADVTTGWPSSPHHFANMVNRQWNQMGWASGYYPASVTQIIEGPGKYLGDGNYSTEETITEIPPEYRGLVKAFVVVFVAG